MQVSPSILTCDFAHLADEIAFVERSGADMIHLDVMDGVFVPNLSFGPPVIERIRPLTGMTLDVHLMMQYPDRLIPAFAKAGADILNIHAECASPLAETLAEIRRLGKKAALTLKPATPAEAAFPYLDKLDMVLVMTVEPGFGGQAFMEHQLDTISQVRALINRYNPACRLEVDGGVSPKTAGKVIAAGADTLVAGSAVYGAVDPAAAIAALREG